MDVEYEEGYFCFERYQLYIDMLGLEKEDFFELMWYFSHTFWSDSVETKEYLIEELKYKLGDDYYSMKL